MTTEEEVTPEWLLLLENRRKRKPLLAHDIGAGAPCLKCLDICPGLDLHFWRKLCRNCKCKKEDHDVKDDDGYEQFHILLGTKKIKIKAVLKIRIAEVEKVLSKEAVQNTGGVPFDWVPPNVPEDVVAEYMRHIPVDKLPISGSEGAVYRRQQLERQVPLHDLDASKCDNLSQEEIEGMQGYLQNLKNNVVGQGKVTKVPVFYIEKCVSSIVPSQLINSEEVFSKPHLNSNTIKNPSFGPPFNFSDLNIMPKPFISHKINDYKLPLSDDLPSPPDSLIQNTSNLSLKTPSAFISHLKPIEAEYSLERHNQFKGHISDVPQQTGNMTHFPHLPSSMAKDGEIVTIQHSQYVPSSSDVTHQNAQISENLNCRISNHSSNLKSVTDIYKNQFPYKEQLLRDKTNPLNFQQSTDAFEKDNSSFPNTFTDPHSNLCKYDSDVLSNPLTNKHSSQAFGQIISTKYPQSVATSGTINNLLNSQMSNISSDSCKNNNSDTLRNIKGGQMDGDSSTLTPKLQNSKINNLHQPSETVGSSLLDAEGNICSENHPNKTNSSCTYPSSHELTSSINNPSRNSLFLGTTPENNSNLQQTSLNTIRNPPTVDISHSISINSDSMPKSAHIIQHHGKTSERLSKLSGLEGVTADVDLAKAVEEAHLECQECAQPVHSGEVAIFAERAGENAMWHPQCFTCHTCKELLVDLVYFFYKSNVYCGRHFADLLNIPRCFACDEIENILVEGIEVPQHVVLMNGDGGYLFYALSYAVFGTDSLGHEL
uniref:Testin n=1 Tax=Timema tahoe TaxID=61484 RepID=A0A7R9NX31_9NEOP|nr:unnamed protein product [Timema tahoe]